MVSTIYKILIRTTERIRPNSRPRNRWRGESSRNKVKVCYFDPVGPALEPVGCSCRDNNEQDNGLLRRESISCV